MAQRTINSPGVEIRESDLSLTAPLNVGTNVYVTGFAQQGPLDEVLKITTKQELNNIFGPPTNSSERYFYYTLNELLNSPANVYASRLPYGHGTGDGFGSKYSALVYPVRNVTGDSQLGQLSSFHLNQKFTAADSHTALSGVEIQIQSGRGVLSSVVFGFGTGAEGASNPQVGGNTGSCEFSTTSSTQVKNGGTTNVIQLSASKTGGNSPQSIRHALSSVVRLSAGYTVAARPVTPGNDTFNFMASAGNAPNTYASTSVKIGLTGASALKTIGVITPSVLSPFTGATDTFTLSAESNQQISTNLDTASAVYVLGQPTHLELTESQYLSALEDTAFTWSATAGAKDSFATIANAGAAGAVILNKSTSTINNQFEGYYVGLADNTNTTPGSNFNNILTTKTLTQSAASTTSFTIIPAGTQVFKLSANFQTGTTNSVSEVMENLTEFEIDGRDDDDILSLGVFKLRKSIYANEAFKLDYVLEDGIAGSINYYRTKLNPAGGLDVPFFVESRDDSSRNVVVKVNDYVSNRLRGTNALDANGNVNKRVRVLTTQLATNTDAQGVAKTGIDAAHYTALDTALGKAESIYGLGAYTEATVKGKELGDIPNKLERALDGVKNDDIYDIDVVVEGGLGTIYAIASADSTTYYDEYSATSAAAVNGLRTSNDITGDALTLRNNYSTIFNKFEQFCSPPYLGGGRGDCIFIADPLRQIFIQGSGGRVLDNKNKNFQTDIYWPIRHQFANENTSYATVYGNWALVYDSYSGRQVYVPFSGFAGATMARTDAATFPWFAPAGFTRGLVTFANDIAVNPNQKQRDELYKANINPVAQFPSQGLVIFGQKTLSKKSSAFDRINVRRLFLNLERPTKKASRFFVFEQNTEFTRTRLVNTLTPIFERAKNNEGLFDYLIVCDERNNTPAVIDANELVVDIYIKPTRTAEFILVNFYATRTDANFEELIGG
jgi:phage tail sheath protein FI